MILKVVLDTNVWISALLNPGVARKIVDSFEANLFVLYCADELLAELTTVLRRSKFTGKIGSQRTERLIELVQRKATFAPIKKIPFVSRDPKDNIFLACAISTDCDFLVTGDGKDLLILGQYKQTKIV